MNEVNIYCSSDEVAAKVAAHASDCYKEAYTSAKTESAKKIIPVSVIYNSCFIDILNKTCYVK